MKEKDFSQDFLVKDVEKKEEIRKLGENLSNSRVILSKEAYREFFKKLDNEEHREFYKNLESVLEKNDLPSLEKITPHNPYAEITPEDWKIIKKTKQFIVLHITSLCNSNCNICYEEVCPTQEDMSIQDIKFILSKIGKNKRVSLFGGEPTVRDDIFEIIKIVRDSGNYPELYTNGLRLEDENFVKKLKESGIKKVAISFDGFNERIYKELRNDSEQYYKKLKALENLQRYNIPTILISLIAEGINDDQIPELIKFLKEDIERKGCIKGINFYSATPYGKFNVNVEKGLTHLDILKIIEKTSLGEIKKDYFIEFTKFLINTNKILNRVGIGFPYVGGMCARFSYENGKLKEIIPLNEIKDINKLIEERNIFGVLFKSLKYRKFLEFIDIFDKGKVTDLQYEKGVYTINIAFIRTPNHTSDYSNIATIAIYKSKEKRYSMASFAGA
ncbi:MAG: radical SAM protein [Candidatus Altiarchaeota archaeon]